MILSLATLAQLSEVEVEEVYASAVHYWVSKGVLAEVPEPVGASSRGAGTSFLSFLSFCGCVCIRRNFYF